MGYITEQELDKTVIDKLNNSDNIKDIVKQSENSIDEKLKPIKKDIDSLKTSVDNGKSGLYSAIIGKKVTPRSKDFVDLTSAVNLIQTENTEQNKKYESQIKQLTTEKSQLQSKINSIKPAKGNAQPSDVLENKTFTNDNGNILTGNIKYLGNKVINCFYNDQKLEKGYYNDILIKGLNNMDQNDILKIMEYVIKNNNNKEIISKDIFKDIVKNIKITDLKNELSTINIKGYQVKSIELEPRTISHQSSEEWNFQFDFDPCFIIVPVANYCSSFSFSIGYNKNQSYSTGGIFGGQFLSLNVKLNSNSINVCIHNSWKRDSHTSNKIQILVFDTNICHI